MAEDKSDDTKDGSYEKLERVLGQFAKYHMRILLGDLNAKVGREAIFKPIIENENSHEIGSDNGVRVVNCTIQKICQEYDLPTLQHS
jgi:hypothetical protein